MSKEHKENLNLLFYDFNHMAMNIQEEDKQEDEFDLETNPHDGSFKGNMMTNTGTNFFSRFGDRLPTRETKSRRGRINIITSQNGQRGRSMVETS